ncbi:MAG: hypothetical protein ABL895_00170 [Cyclobacteriaceae bacterium]
MLRIFRVNDPYRLLGILMLLVLVGLALFLDPVGITLNELRSIVLGELLNDGKSLYSQLMTSTPPFASWFSGWVDLLFGRSLTARHILSLLIIFFQGAFFAILLINNKAQNESTYLPALIFGVLCFFSFDMLSLSGELLGSTFLLFALNNLFKEVEFRIQQDSILLNLGIYLGIASLIVFSYSVFLPGTLIILLLFTRLTIRKALILIFGFLLPHALLAAVYFARGDFSSLWYNFYMGNEWMSSNLISLSSMVYLSFIPITYFIFSLVMLNRDARLTKYQSQLLQIMFVWLLIAIAEIILSGKMSPSRVITFAPPLAYFTSHYFLLISRKWIGELMIWLFIGGILITSYLARYQKIGVIDYNNLFPAKSAYSNQIKGKRVLVLGTDWGLYESNQMASHFYDWQLAEQVFTKPDYFENVVKVDQSFIQDSPEIIVDKSNLMVKMMERIPRLRQDYTKQGDLYIRN